MISHVTANAASISGVPSVFISAPGGNNKISIGDLNGSGIGVLSIGYGSDHSQGDSVSVNGGSGNDQFTLTTGQDTLFNVPTPQTPDPFPNAGPAPRRRPRRRR